MSADNILEQCEDIELSEPVTFGKESFDYRDIDCDWPASYSESEDYYQDNNDPSEHRRWIAPLKEIIPVSNLEKVTGIKLDCMQFIFAIPKNLCSNIESEGYFVGTNVYEGDFYHDFEVIEKIPTNKNAQIFCFPKRYILPIKSQKHSWQNYCVFYNPNTRPDCCEAYNFSGYYLPQFIKYVIKNGELFENKDYDEQYFKKYYDLCRESYLKYIDEMIQYEASSNRKIFSEEMKQKFIEETSANKQLY